MGNGILPPPPYPPSGLTNPMTSRGAMITGGVPSGGVAPATALALGSANTVLSSNGTDPVYATIATILASLATTTGDRIVRNGSGAVVRLPVGALAMPADDIDFAAGDVQTKTISGSTTFTASNETWGHATVLLVLAVSGSPAEPTWPGTTTKVGSGTWSTSLTNYVFLTRTGSGTFIRSVAQAS